VFLGEYQHSLDAKGRVILPARFRAHLEEGCVLTKGRNGCIAVYPRAEWERLADQVAEMQLTTQQARDVARVIFGGASEQVPDRQGRVLIPEHLRHYAELERDVTIAAAKPSFFEIWAAGRYQDHMGGAEREFSEIAAANPDIPF
jgi:MraZ protein